MYASTAACNLIDTRQRLLIVDDHEIVREGLRGAFENDDAVRIVGLVADGRSALERAEATNPSVAIVDLHLPDVPGDELCRRLVAAVPGIHIIVLSSYLNEDSVRRSYQAGAKAYVTKAAGLGELRRAVRTTTDAAVQTVDPSVSRTMRDLERLTALRAGDDQPTQQQIRVLELIAYGLTYEAISARMFISQSTVRYHVQNLKLKLGVRSRGELLVKALSLGLIARPEDEASGASS